LTVCAVPHHAMVMGSILLRAFGPRSVGVGCLVLIGLYDAVGRLLGNIGCLMMAVDDQSAKVLINLQCRQTERVGRGRNKGI
jgi:hypothetical protein